MSCQKVKRKDTLLLTLPYLPNRPRDCISEMFKVKVKVLLEDKIKGLRQLKEPLELLIRLKGKDTTTKDYEQARDVRRLK